MTPGVGPSRPECVDQVRPAARATRLAGWRLPLMAASLFLAVHLAYLAPSLDDIDAVNFAFGVREFDPAAHRPHPPGYPVYIALGKASTAIVDAVRPADRLAPLRRDNAAIALALWSALFGAVGLLACYALFQRLETLGASPVPPRERGADGSTRSGPSVAAWAAILAAVAPLAWLTTSRPMSDVPGLAAALAAQALLLEAWGWERKPGLHGTWTTVRDPLLLGALVAALALGVRSQVLWLTLPLLAAVLVGRVRRHGLLAALPGACAYVAGVLAWAVPMVAVTGWPRYLAALGGQGAEDFSGVDMLWTHLGLRRLAVGLWQTFVLPWSSAPLAVVVLLAAAAGLLVMWRRTRVALAWLALLAGPYAVFHILFHETVTTRYALPLLPAVCYLAVRAFAAAGRRPAIGLLLVTIGWSLAIGLPAMRAYAAAPSPVFRAVGVLNARAGASIGEAVLGLHRSARPALEWTAGIEPWSRRLPSPPHQEWTQALRVLREEPDRTVLFLGDAVRRGELRNRDLALIDPRGVRAVREFRWDIGAPGMLDGVRPGSIDLYEIREPGWIAGEGWALTPETAGMAEKTRRGPSFGPIEALVRRRPDDTMVLVGGRHLGGAAEGPARIDLRVDGRPVGSMVVDPQPQFFLHLLRLPAGALDGPGAFGTLTLAVSPTNGPARPAHVAIEQFDAAGADRVLAGYDTGWQESEYDPSRQQMWRWMSERGTVRVHAGDGGGRLALRLAAESPRKYFDRPSVVTIRVGGRVLWSLTPDERLPRLLARLAKPSTFSAEVLIDRDELARASHRITIEADQFFVPADREQNEDRRHLALRVLGLQVFSER